MTGTLQNRREEEIKCTLPPCTRWSPGPKGQRGFRDQQIALHCGWPLGCGLCSSITHGANEQGSRQGVHWASRNTYICTFSFIQAGNYAEIYKLLGRTISLGFHIFSFKVWFRMLLKNGYEIPKAGIYKHKSTILMWDLKILPLTVGVFLTHDWYLKIPHWGPRESTCLARLKPRLRA